MKKIMIGIPVHIGGMSAQFHLSVTNLAHQLITSGFTVDINYEEGSLLSSQRNKIARLAWTEGYNLLFLDSDMVFDPKDAIRLINSGKGLIGGLYYGRRAPYMPLVFGEDLTEEKYVFRSVADSNIPDEIFLCKGMGAGFLYISHSALSDIWGWCLEQYDEVGEAHPERPFNFMELRNGDQYGEDLSFFRRCNLMGLKIWCDPRGDIGHKSERIVYRHDHQMHNQRDYHYCNDIPGWMTVREQNWLYETAKKMDSIAEVGCWKGKGTHALCSGCRGMVTAVDHFEGSEGERETYHNDAGNSYNEFAKNVGNRFSNLKRVYVGDSVTAAYEMRNEKFDMVFIDADHTYDEVLADLKAWEPLATKIISGHDYTNMSGVQRAVNEYFKTADIQTYESIWWVEK